MKLLLLTFWMMLGLVIWAAAIVTILSTMSGHWGFQIVYATPPVW